MSVFDEVKRMVPVRAAAGMYGYRPNRSGFICCPFHHEKTPSMKLYAGGGGFYCFGCGRGGSVIEFTADLFGLSALDAVKKLNEDFSLGLDLDCPPDREQVKRVQRRRDTERDFEVWREGTINQLNQAFRTGWTALRDKRPETWTDGEILSITELPRLEYWVDTLSGGNLDDCITIFRERKKVNVLCREILDDMSKKSGTGWKLTA